VSVELHPDSILKASGEEEWSKEAEYHTYVSDTGNKVGKVGKATMNPQYSVKQYNI
jgi:hypothetical protein